jgi:hypothetical protein
MTARSPPRPGAPQPQSVSAPVDLACHYVERSDRGTQGDGKEEDEQGAVHSHCERKLCLLGNDVGNMDV